MDRAIGHVYRSYVPADAPYYVTLDRIHQHVRPRGYLEVGVYRGLALALALPGTRAVGIDPDPHVAFPLTRRARVVQDSSDDAFAVRDLWRLLGRKPLDLAFIDGRHLFEFALRDFMNIERLAHPGTVVLLHDCLPHDERSASRARETQLWSGDVWKLIPTLRKWRPELQVHVIDVAPAGLGIISGLVPGNRVLERHYDEIVRNAADIHYQLLVDEGPVKVLNSVPGDWGTVKGLLPERPFRQVPITVLTAWRAAWAWLVHLAGRRAERGASGIGATIFRRAYNGST
ncbi:MAG TPA: class I SAM-dependent methyltransferase [Acidimicrobiales bacterium]|nr:class I SAM-dependent methyltransferase [Acidimicrobiales bacterium]